MLALSVPGWKAFRLEHLLLDVNGTLALDGVLLPGVQDRLSRLQEILQVHLLSADTFGRLDAIAATLGVHATKLQPGQPEVEQKASLLRTLGPEAVVAIGNGANDEAMLRDAALAIGVLGPEGLAVGTLLRAHIIVRSAQEGLDLLLNPRRVVASLRR